MKPAVNPEVWLEEHGNYLFRYAMMRLHDKEVAEDMVQETLLAALKGKDRFKGEASVRTWLVGILKHKILDHMRRSGRELSVSGLLSEGDESADLFDEKGKWRQEPTPWQDDPRTALEQKEFWETMVRCMSELPRRLAQIFALRELEGKKGDEICNLMEISPTSLGVIIYRARMRLRKCLQSRWFGRAA